MGKNSLSFLEKLEISYKCLKSSLSTADGSRQNVIGFCILPIEFKGVTKDIHFYIVPSLNQEAYFGINFWKEFALAPDIFNVSEMELESCNNEEKLDFHILNPEQKLTLEKTILLFPSFEKLGLGCTNLLEHHIDTANSEPIKSKHYPLSPPRQEEAYREIDRLLAMAH